MKNITLLLSLFFSISAFSQSIELVKNIGTLPNDAAFGDPEKFTELNEEVYFFASDGSDAGTELWRSDGTEAGTELTGDINVNTVADNSFFSAPFSQPVVLGGSIFWSSRENLAGPGQNSDFHTKLWKISSGGSPELVFDTGTESYSSPLSLTVFNGNIYFINGAFQLWRSNGTAVGTTMVLDAGDEFLNDLTVVGNELFFTRQIDDLMNFFDTKTDIWKTDGTAAGTQFVKRAVGDAPYDCGLYEVDLFELDGGLAYTLFGSSYCSYDTWIITENFAPIQEISVPAASLAVIDPLVKDGKVYYFTQRFESTGLVNYLRVLDGSGVANVKPTYPSQQLTASTFWVIDVFKLEVTFGLRMERRLAPKSLKPLVALLLPAFSQRMTMKLSS